jgi:hypothetical protein
MQDRYTGDVGDFGKFGLLRWLCGFQPPADPVLAPGIIWYLVSDESHNRDGKHIGYLKGPLPIKDQFQCCDSDLYQKLEHLVESGRRRVSAIQSLRILPPSTTYFGEQQSFARLGRDERRPSRRLWFERAAAAVQRADLVFIDPDNGLETPSTQAHHRQGAKYAFFEDLRPFIDRGQSLIVYQHLNRSASASVQAQRRLEQIRERLSVETVWAVQFRRGSGRLYIVIPARQHEALLSERASQLLLSRWGQQGHFQPVITHSGA